MTFMHNAMGGLIGPTGWNGDNIDGFGAAVAEVVRAGGGMLIRYKQAQALKEAVSGAEPVMQKLSISVIELMGLYICGAVDEHGDCVLDDDGKPFPGFGELVETRESRTPNTDHSVADALRDLSIALARLANILDND